jgi:hypothetical protein
MDEFFAWDYHGAPFDLFGPAHLGALLALLVFNLLLTRAKNASDRTRSLLRWTLALILWTNESAWHIWRIANGPVDAPDHAAVTDLQPHGLGFGHYVGYAQF